MTTRESKRIWRHRQAAIQSFMRRLRKSPDQSSLDSGVVQRILSGYRREWTRYQRLIHANDTCRLHA
jgi:hypothetical protein